MLVSKGAMRTRRKANRIELCVELISKQNEGLEIHQPKYHKALFYRKIVFFGNLKQDAVCTFWRRSRPTLSKLHVDVVTS